MLAGKFRGKKGNTLLKKINKKDQENKVHTQKK